MMNKIFSFFLAFLCLLVLSCKALKRESKREVLMEFRLTTKGVYCGGARPSEEMLAELSKPNPLADFQFYIKPGKINDPNTAAIASSITDAEGLAFVNLQPGEYVVVFEDKLDWTVCNQWKEEHNVAAHPYGAMDTLCLNQWIQRPEANFEVKTGTNPVIAIERQETCFWNNIPCIEYIGSLPP